MKSRQMFLDQSQFCCIIIIQVTQDYKFKTKEVSVGHITCLHWLTKLLIKSKIKGIEMNIVHYIVKNCVVAIEVWKINK
jgi:hypothetical protein